MKNCVTLRAVRVVLIVAAAFPGSPAGAGQPRETGEEHAEAEVVNQAKPDKSAVGIREIIVRAAPLPIEAGQFGRTVEVLGTNEIASSRSASIADLLEADTMVGVGERGAGIVQSDLSIRGSTFQQVLVTLDGLPLADPQTAHHNMDLPFPVAAIEQITVIPGPGSALFGPAAFAGVVDLTPRRPDVPGVTVESVFGTFETWRAGATIDGVTKSSSTTVASSYERSDGFQEGTDYETWSAWAASFLDTGRGFVRLSAGHADKDFGARDFYAAYPSRERTESTVVDLAPHFEIAPDWLLKAAVRYRRHGDEFILIEDDPAFYRNTHVTDTFIERVMLTAPEYALGRTAVGIERSDATLDSSNLGDRDASTTSAFLQHRVSGGAYTADFGLRADNHTTWATEASPSFSVSVPIGEALTWRASAARGIRPPSFTELYYNDPVNIGNPDLEPEEAWGGETGLELAFSCETRSALTYFLRDAENLIDWVRRTEEEPWEATNIGAATFQGAEARIAGKADPLNWETAYRYTHVDAESGGMQSKYALNVARHDLRLSLVLPERRGFSASATARYRDVPALDRYWLISARLGRRIWKTVVFIKGRNLLDEDYEEIPGVPTAGRYVEAGIEVAL